MRPPLLAILAMLFLGSAFIFDKLAAMKMSPDSLLFVRLVVMAVMALGVCVFTAHWRQVATVDAWVWLWIFASSLLGTVGLILYYLALRRGGDISIVGPITAAAPVVGAVMAVIFLGELLTLMRIAGIALVLCGIWLLSRA
jgi:transporter family protein